jgi:hypothetical protein
MTAISIVDYKPNIRASVCVQFGRRIYRFRKCDMVFLGLDLNLYIPSCLFHDYNAIFHHDLINIISISFLTVFKYSTRSITLQIKPKSVYIKSGTLF